MAQLIRFRRLKWGPPPRLVTAGRRSSRLPVLGLTLLAFVIGAMVMALATPGGLSRLADRFTGVKVPIPAPAAAISAGFSLCRDRRGSCVIDGDTFDHEGLRYRIADIDTPETRNAACDSERRLGEQATLRLQQLLNQGPFELHPAGRDEDVYGRKLRLVTRNGQSLGAILVAENLAHVWDGRKHPWC